ncbi:hypothetical protein L208DRAFT_1400739 [Tricholoma matsutake]|nr:hypothetical protein L208DRAFT_1400739 [Tricholoma matsutake 945]
MTTFVKARCHCGLNAFNIAFPILSLPIPSDLWGLTFTNEPDDLRLKHLTFWAIRYFCSRCSADILWQHIAKQE